MKKKVIIVGWGNISRQAHRIIRDASDMEVVAIASRRPEGVREEFPTKPSFMILGIQDPTLLEMSADAVILGGGSKADLPVTAPWAVSQLPVKVLVDSFDTHGKISNHIDRATNLPALGYHHQLNLLARGTEKTHLLGQGWDPGFFSMMRTLFESFLPGSKAYTLYGLGERGGLSMGHSDACRKVDGVLDARSYTHAKVDAIESIRRGFNPILEPGAMHWRENFIVAKDGANIKMIEATIKTMPDYFADYDTVVHFISKDDMIKHHQKMLHNGLVIAVKDDDILELKLRFEDNPRGTAGILVSAVRAGLQMHDQGRFGAFLPQEVPPSAFWAGDFMSLIKKT